MRKYFILALGVLVIGLGLYLSAEAGTAKLSANSVTEKQSSLKATAKNMNTDIDKVEIKADFEKLYNRIEDLAADADVIIEGEVLKINSFDFNTSTYTRSEVKVTKSYNDHVKKGDILTFVEIGGVTTKGALMNHNAGKMNVSKEELRDPVQVVFDGSPVMKSGEKVLIFGVEPTQKNLMAQTYYFPIGSYQGKFNLKGDSIERFVPKGETTYPSLKMQKTDFEKKIAKYIK